MDSLSTSRYFKMSNHNQIKPESTSKFRFLSFYLILLVVIFLSKDMLITIVYWLFQSLLKGVSLLNLHLQKPMLLIFLTGKNFEIWLISSSFIYTKFCCGRDTLSAKNEYWNFSPRFHVLSWNHLKYHLSERGYFQY